MAPARGRAHAPRRKDEGKPERASGPLHEICRNQRVPAGENFSLKKVSAAVEVFHTDSRHPRTSSVTGAPNRRPSRRAEELPGDLPLCEVNRPMDIADLLSAADSLKSPRTPGPAHASWLCTRQHSRAAYLSRACSASAPLRPEGVQAPLPVPQESANREVAQDVHGRLCWQALHVEPGSNAFAGECNLGRREETRYLGGMVCKARVLRTNVDAHDGILRILRSTHGLRKHPGAGRSGMLVGSSRSSPPPILVCSRRREERTQSHSGQSGRQASLFFSPRHQCEGGKGAVDVPLRSRRLTFRRPVHPRTPPSRLWQCEVAAAGVTHGAPTASVARYGRRRCSAP